MKMYKIISITIKQKLFFINITKVNYIVHNKEEKKRKIIIISSVTYHRKKCDVLKINVEFFASSEVL